MRDRALGSTIRIYFTTHQSTGVAVAPSSAFVAADFRIYKDGSATEKTTANGITVTSPFDSVVGAHLIEIDTSNATGDTGFWASGSAYRVVLSTAKTVDSKDPSGVCVGEFSIELQTADVRKFGGTAITAAAGIPEVKVASIATDAVNAAALAANAVSEIQSGLATQTSVDDLPTNAELATALGTADDAVLAAIATVQSDTNDIQTRLPAALESGRIAAALDSATRVKLDASQPDYAPATAAALAAAKTILDKVDTGLVVDGAVYQFTANMLELGPSGSSTVTVLPATGIVADRSAGTTLTPVVGETISQSITVYQSDGTTAVSLSGKTLKVIFETMSGVDVAVVAAADITISGASSNVVTFAYPSAVTASERTLRFAIRDAAAPLTMYLQGVCSVIAAPKVDA